ncbi:tetratricopeptide repeat protein [Flavobacteriaceae bacterium]|nr:tetratricopeptide repeat protein [Flavobacteriaceae bacterium]
MQNKQINFQLDQLGLSKIDLSEIDLKEFEILVKVDGGVSERLIVNDGDLCLVCTMEWNIGEFKYYIPPKILYTLLSQKPFNEINSSDLFEYNQELWETKSGNLTINSVNDFDLEDIDQISIILEGTDYELIEEEKDSSHDQLRSIIEDKMHSLYSKGNIDDSEIDFSNLYSLEIKNYDNASVSTSWWSSYLEMARTEHDVENFTTSINYSLKYLDYELDTNVEDYIKNIDLSKSIPDNISSTFRLISESFEHSEQWEKAIEYYLHYVKINPNNDYGHAHIARCYDELEQIDDAIEFYKKAIDINPHNIYAVTQYADVLVNKKEDVESALKVLNDGIQNNPTQPENTTNISWLFRLKGEIYFKKEDFKQALDGYNKAIEVDKMIKGGAFIFLRLAIIHYNLDQYKESIKSFYKCFDLDGETYKGVYSYYYLAESLKNEKLYEESANYFQLVLEQNNENYNPYAYQGLGFVKLKLKDYSSSISAYQKADKNKWNHQNLGKAFFGLGEYSNALKELNNVIEIDPKYKWAYHWKGDSHFQLGEFDEALKAYEKLIELSSNYIDYDTRHIGRNIALLYHYFEKYEKAIYYYNEFKYDKRETLWKHYLLLMALKKDKASNIFKNPKQIQFLSDESLSSNADKTILDKARLNRVISKPYYQEIGTEGFYNHEICLNDISIILKSSPNNYEALYQRANILSGNVVPKESFTKEGLKIIDFESSKKDLIECIKINNFLPAFKLLISIENDNIKLINEVVSNGNKLFKDDWSWWFSAAKSMKKIEQLNKSKDYFLKSIKYNSENSESYYEIGNVYLALDDAKNSIKSFKEAIQIAEWQGKYRCGLCKAYLLNSNINLAEKEIITLLKTSTSTHFPEKSYYDQYFKVLEEKHDKPYLINLFREYISETWSSFPSGFSYNEDGSLKISYDQHQKNLNILNENITMFLNKSDNMKSNKEDLFEHWGLFNDTEIENFLIKGSYLTKLSLSKNKSLTKKQLLILLENGSFSILENVVANPLLNIDELKKIILGDDLSYQYSYKLMGAILNPNADLSLIESLKNNSFNWVKKLAYSKVEKYSKEDLNDKYKLLGLIENDKIDKSLKPTFHKKLKLTEGNKYTIKFNDHKGSMLEYVYSEFEYEEIIDELTGSILSDDEQSWYDHCSSNWYNYGDSEYGLTTSILVIYLDSSDFNDDLEIYLGEKELQIEKGYPEGKGIFIFEASSYEAGEFVFEEMTLEFEFRPECLSIETSDYKMLISAIEYNDPATDEQFYSKGELVHSRTKGTDIELYFKKKNGELTCVSDYEDINKEIMINMDKHIVDNREMNFTDEEIKEVNKKAIDDYFDRIWWHGR